MGAIVGGIFGGMAGLAGVLVLGKVVREILNAEKRGGNPGTPSNTDAEAGHAFISYEGNHPEEFQRRNEEIDAILDGSATSIITPRSVYAEKEFMQDGEEDMSLYVATIIPDRAFAERVQIWNDRKQTLETLLMAYDPIQAVIGEDLNYVQWIESFLGEHTWLELMGWLKRKFPGRKIPGRWIDQVRDEVELGYSI